jgi:hypothetical protein
MSAMSPLCTQKRTFINHCYRLIYDCAPWSPALIVGNVSSVAGFGHGNGQRLESLPGWEPNRLIDVEH